MHFSVVKKQRGLLFLRLFLIIGMLISLFLIYEHFSESASKYCTFGANFDCGIVNKGPFANVDGLSYLLTIEWGLPIPLVDIASQHVVLDILTSNAFLGLLTLLFVFLLTNAFKKGKGLWWIKKNKVLSWIRAILLFGVAYGLYLMFIMHSILKTWCIVCLGLDVVLWTSTIIAFTIKK